MNIARGQRKIRAYDTGQVTIRRAYNEAGKLGFIIIAWHNDWEKSHAINPALGKPFSKGSWYSTKGQAWEALRNLPNCKRLPSVAMPLAKGDFYYYLLADRPADKR